MRSIHGTGRDLVEVELLGGVPPHSPLGGIVMECSAPGSLTFEGVDEHPQVDQGGKFSSPAVHALDDHERPGVNRDRAGQPPACFPVIGMEGRRCATAQRFHGFGLDPGVPVAQHIYVGQKASWEVIGGDAPQYEGDVPGS